MADSTREILNGNDDFEVIRQRLLLDAASIELPASLRSENLFSLLDSLPEQEAAEDLPSEEEARPPLRLIRRHWLQLAACAACGVILYAGIYRVVQQSAGVSPLLMGSAPAASTTAGVAPMAAPTTENEEAAPVAELPPENEATARVALLGGQAQDDTAASPGARSAPRMAPLPERAHPEAQSYDEVAREIDALLMRNNEAYTVGEFTYHAEFELSASADAPRSAAKSNVTTAGGGGESGAMSGVFQTNAQVEGVDEADIVKTDGTYIYQYRRDRTTGDAEVAIVGATNLKLISTIKLDDFDTAEMYVQDNCVLLVRELSAEQSQPLRDQITQPLSALTGSTSSDESKVIVPEYISPSQRSSGPMTETLVYDISDRKVPQQLGRYAQDGRYVTSRLKEGTVYVVTNKGINWATPIYSQAAGDVLPIQARDGKAELLPATDILLPPYIESSSYAVVSALSFRSGERSNKAILGMAETIMMSQQNLFLTSTVPRDDYRGPNTGVTRLSVDGIDIKYVSSGSVPGYIDNQFSLDEYNGNLRIATTSYKEQDWVTQNNLYVLDSAMKQIGSVEGLAENERIYSVRFMQEMAYVVTFRDTDPLFVIDLSNPTKPVVKGELKIPGFSEYLHPIDKNTLVGLGRNTITTSYGGTVTDGIKLSLFDVSDPSNPIETANYLMGNGDSYTPALDDHRAVMYDPQRRLIGFPATICTAQGGSSDDMWRYSSTVAFSGYLLLEVEKEGFELAAKIQNAPTQNGFEHYDFNNSIERGLYIGKTFYACSPGRLTAYSMDTYQPIGELVYAS